MQYYVKQSRIIMTKKVPDIYINQNFNGVCASESCMADIGRFVVEAIQEYCRIKTLGEREFMQMDAEFRRDLKKS